MSSLAHFGGKVGIGAGSATFTAVNNIPLRAVEGLVTWNSNSPSSNITLAGGTLAGTGQLQKLVSELAGGLISPGTSAGTLQCARAALDSSITLRMEANGLTAGTEFDQIICDSGEVGLDDAILDFRPGFIPAVDDNFTLITGASSISGTFANLPERALFSRNGIAWQITYRGGNGSDVIVTRIAVPDPVILSYTRIPGTGINSGSDVVDFVIQGTPGLTYHLEVSGDLQTWTTLATQPADERGAVPFEFLELQTLRRRCYRVRLE